MFYVGRPGVIYSDLQGANQVQISAHQGIEKLRKRELANQLIYIDLHPICRLQINANHCRGKQRFWKKPSLRSKQRLESKRRIFLGGLVAQNSAASKTDPITLGLSTVF